MGADSEPGAPNGALSGVGQSRSGIAVGREGTSLSTEGRLPRLLSLTLRTRGGGVPFLTRLPTQWNEAVGARQWLARLYYGFNRRTWTSRYRQIYNSIQSVRHTQGRCKQGRGPESGCAKWARRGDPGRAPSSPGSTLARRAVRRGLFAGPRGPPPSPGAERRTWACGEARRPGARRRAHPVLLPRPHRQLRLLSLKRGLRGSGRPTALPGAPRPRAAPQRVPDPRLGTVIPDPTAAPTRIRIELRYARPGPAWRGHLGSYGAGASLPGLRTSSPQARPLIPGPARRERGLRGRPLRTARLPRRVPSAQRPAGARGSQHTPPAPSRGKLQLIRFFSQHFFSDVFLFCFVSFGRAEWGPEKQTHNQPGGGEVGRRGLRGRGGRGVARSSAPPPPRRRAGRGPAGPGGGGQLLYWHALRPEAGPCSPP